MNDVTNAEQREQRHKKGQADRPGMTLSASSVLRGRWFFKSLSIEQIVQFVPILKSFDCNNRRVIKNIIFALGVFFCNALASQENVRFVAVLEPVGNNGVTALNKLSARGTLEEFITRSMEYKGVDRVRTNQILMEHSFQRNGMVDNGKVKDIGEMLGADFVCVSELHKEEGYINVTISLIDVKTGVLAAVRNKIMAGENPIALQNLVESMASDLLGESRKHRHAREQVERGEEEIQERLVAEDMDRDRRRRQMESEKRKTAEKEAGVEAVTEKTAKFDQSADNQPVAEAFIQMQPAKFGCGVSALTNTTLGLKKLTDDTKVSPVSVGVAVFGRWQTARETIAIRTDLDFNTYRTNHNDEKNEITRYSLRGGLVYIPKIFSGNGIYFCIQSGISLWDIKRTSLTPVKPVPKKTDPISQKNNDKFSKFAGAALFGIEKRVFGKQGVASLMECGVDFNFLDKNETALKEYNGFTPALVIKAGMLW